MYVTLGGHVKEIRSIGFKYIAKTAKAKPMTAQMKPHIFKPFDSILTIGFCKNFKLTCDTNAVHEKAVMWLIKFFMKKTASAVLSTGLSVEGIEKKYSRSASFIMRYFITNPDVPNSSLKKTQPMMSEQRQNPDSCVLRSRQS